MCGGCQVGSWRQAKGNSSAYGTVLWKNKMKTNFLNNSKKKKEREENVLVVLTTGTKVGETKRSWAVLTFQDTPREISHQELPIWD